MDTQTLTFLASMMVFTHTWRLLPFPLPVTVFPTLVLRCLPVRTRWLHFHHLIANTKISFSKLRYKHCYITIFKTNDFHININFYKLTLISHSSGNKSLFVSLCVYYFILVWTIFFCFGILIRIVILQINKSHTHYNYAVFTLTETDRVTDTQTYAVWTFLYDIIVSINIYVESLSRYLTVWTHHQCYWFSLIWDILCCYTSFYWQKKQTNIFISALPYFPLLFIKLILIYHSIRSVSIKTMGSTK